ncbi:MAG: two-component system response regulator [Magnetococcales bacterium]|nr:two-component system response regulator [Magnetococcales bacterium]
MTVLIVDDVPENIAILAELLKGEYKLKMANCGQTALVAAATGSIPDMILLDIMMPKMDGYMVCQRLKADERTRDIPVIFLTSRAEIEDETKGLAMGAVDYITKPIHAGIVKSRVRTQLTLKSARDFLKQQNGRLEEMVLERTRKLEELQDVTMIAMGALAEARDPETGNHIRRTQNYVRLLAGRLQDHPRFSDFLSPNTISLLYKTAPLHDIGKVGVPDHILLKPGPLTNAEFEQMKRHTVYGHDALAAAETALQGQEDFLVLAKQIAHGHHEKWDGSGYPASLAGDAIPIAARIMAIADVYDALISRRVYKPPFSHEKSVGIVRDGRGTHFDPDMVDAFLEIAESFRQTAETYKDS